MTGLPSFRRRPASAGRLLFSAAVSAHAAGRCAGLASHELDRAQGGVGDKVGLDPVTAASRVRIGGKFMNQLRLDIAQNSSVNTHTI